MITAAALTFPRFHACVTSSSGQPDAPGAATVVTCSNVTQVTIYNCRIHVPAKGRNAFTMDPKATRRNPRTRRNFLATGPRLGP